MSNLFLSRRSGTESSYFKLESELAATRLRARLDEANESENLNTAPPSASDTSVDISNVLPEILRHSVPLSRRSAATHVSRPIVERHTDELIDTDVHRAAMDAMAPIGHVPQVALGRSKYSVPLPGSFKFVASTANLKRVNGADSQKLQVLAEGLGTVSKAFGVATLLVYGGAAVAFLAVCQALETKSLDEIPIKVKSMVHPHVLSANDRLEPIRQKIISWTSKWKMSEDEQQAIGFKFSKLFGVRRDVK